jgi:hypothetical protein
MAKTPSPWLRRAVQVAGISRAGFGLYLAAAPGRAAKSWFGVKPDRPETGVLLRSVGARDLLIGAGVAAAEQPGPWLRAAAGADLVDALAMLTVSSKLPKRNVVVGVAGAGGFAIIGVVLERLTGNRDRK